MNSPKPQPSLPDAFAVDESSDNALSSALTELDAPPLARDEPAPLSGDIVPAAPPAPLPPEPPGLLRLPEVAAKKFPRRWVRALDFNRSAPLELGPDPQTADSLLQSEALLGPAELSGSPEVDFPSEQLFAEPEGPLVRHVESTVFPAPVIEPAPSNFPESSPVAVTRLSPEKPADSDLTGFSKPASVPDTSATTTQKIPGRTRTLLGHASPGKEAGSEALETRKMRQVQIPNSLAEELRVHAREPEVSLKPVSLDSIPFGDPASAVLSSTPAKRSLKTVEMPPSNAQEVVESHFVAQAKLIVKRVALAVSVVSALLLFWFVRHPIEVDGQFQFAAEPPKLADGIQLSLLLSGPHYHKTIDIDPKLIEATEGKKVYSYRVAMTVYSFRTVDTAEVRVVASPGFFCKPAPLSPQALASLAKRSQPGVIRSSQPREPQPLIVSSGPEALQGGVVSLPRFELDNRVFN